ncbi:MAG TPA: hypothetical protein VHV77_06290, partial [Pirellulales bacterium]|nr:hypothetical protein [Pirellulales bacterium]
MHRAHRGVLALLIVVSSWLASGSALAQVAFVTPPAAAPSEIPSLIQRGMKLETERRWGEALTLYEEALRTFP